MVDGLTKDLLPPAPDNRGTPVAHSTGILPSQALRDAIAGGEILAEETIQEDQIQPASIDLRLGSHAYRIRASFLPGKGSTVGQKLRELSMHRLDLTDGAVLERNCVYLIPLMEKLALPYRTSAVANPKSSTGRLDVFARVITDQGTEFDHVRQNYAGPLWAEIAPRSFSILVRPGYRLVQLRIKKGSPQWSDSALRRLNETVGLVDAELQIGDKGSRKGMLPVSVDLSGSHRGQLIGYKAKKHAPLIDVGTVGAYEIDDFWERVYARPKEGMVLNPDDFYILASKEAVTIPPDHAAEMLAYDTLVGEFRVHYAGFFDPGFGHRNSDGAGTKAVLEVRSHEVPFLIEDGQIVGRIMYERLTAIPDKIYGTGIGSSYQRQALALGKQFLREAE